MIFVLNKSKRLHHYYAWSLMIVLCSFICCTGQVDISADSEQVVSPRKIVVNGEEVEPEIIETELLDYISDESEFINPYTMSNMRCALNMIREELDNPCGLPNDINIDDIAFHINIQPTDYYITIYPELSTDYEALVDDIMIATFPHPLLLENIDGHYGNELTYLGDIQEEAPALYCACDAMMLDELDANGIPFNIIDTLFIPEHCEALSSYRYWFNNADLPELEQMDTRTQEERDFAEAITYMAFRQAGYETEDIGPIEESWCETKHFLWWTWSDCDTYYHPTGQINIDTPSGLTGASGVQIRLFRWFTTHDVYTDGNGIYYDNRRWKKQWLADEISYTIRTKGKRILSDNRWDLKTSIGGVIPLWPYSYDCGFQRCEGYSVNIYPSSGGLWGRCVLNNAIYDYCVYAENENLSLPPSHLNIATSESETDDWASSCPLLQNHLNFSLLTIPFVGLFLEVIYLITYPILPDMLLKYRTDMMDYNKVVDIVWHELAHASLLKRTVLSNGYGTASVYWSKVVSYEAEHAIVDSVHHDPYGTVGDTNWEQIALAEGWANYREWYMGHLYLNYDNGNSWGFGYSYFVQFYYAAYFSALYNHGITMNEMERALANAYTLAQFKNNLLTICPLKSGTINTYLP